MSDARYRGLGVKPWPQVAYTGELGHRTTLLSIDWLDYDGTAAAWFWRNHKKSDA
jgi:hypothetical protein